MEYTLAIDNAPETVPGGTGILLLHPSTGETDRLDTDFLATDTDSMLVISTRTTAREVKQKLEYYEVDESKATILDTLSVERGYTRRRSEGVRYVSAPDDLSGIVSETETFLQEHDGKLRVTFDSLTELIYYADEDGALSAVEDILDLLDEYDAVGMFHLADEVHDEETVAAFRELFDGVIELSEDGTITSTFEA
jgi:KaiC/GvpD/RAD55 family RecA-like ATPase